MLKDNDRKPMFMQDAQEDVTGIKGLNNHLRRQAIAKERKLEEEQAFLLPS